MEDEDLCTEQVNPRGHYTYEAMKFIQGNLTITSGKEGEWSVPILADRIVKGQK